jgi:hypothetical protein
MPTLFYTDLLWNPSTNPSSAVLNAPLVTPIMAQVLILSSAYRRMHRHNNSVVDAFENLAIFVATLTTSQSVASSITIFGEDVMPSWHGGYDGV